MKKSIALFLVVIARQLTFTQTDHLQWLDIQLSNYEYPLPVSTLELNIQNQTLEIASMDIKPEDYNRKKVLLFSW